MDTVRKVYKPWKPRKIHKKIKLGKLFKKLKKLTKVFKIFKPLFRMLSPSAAAPLHVKGHHHQEDESFMTCIVKVDPTKPGWQRPISKLIKNCKATRLKVDGNGVVEYSAICDPNKQLKKLGKSRQAELRWFQFGECSSYLFMPESKKNPPVQEKPNSDNSNNNNIPYYHAYPIYRSYGYHHYQPPPQVANYQPPPHYQQPHVHYQPPQVAHYQQPQVHYQQPQVFNPYWTPPYY